MNIKLLDVISWVAGVPEADKSHIMIALNEGIHQTFRISRDSRRASSQANDGDSHDNSLCPQNGTPVACVLSRESVQTMKYVDVPSQQLFPRETIPGLRPGLADHL